MSSIIGRLKRAVKNSLFRNTMLNYMYNHFVGCNVFKVGGNTFVCKGNILQRTHVNIRGHGNVVEILPFGQNRLRECRIDVFGNNSVIKIGGG